MDFQILRETTQTHMKPTALMGNVPLFFLLCCILKDSRSTQWNLRGTIEDALKIARKCVLWPLHSILDLLIACYEQVTQNIFVPAPTAMLLYFHIPAYDSIPIRMCSVLGSRWHTKLYFLNTDVYKPLIQCESSWPLLRFKKKKMATFPSHYIPGKR